MSEKLTREEADEMQEMLDKRKRQLAVEELIEKGGFYACRCGWRGAEHSEQCPGCSDWDTIIQVKL